MSRKSPDSKLAFTKTNGLWIHLSVFGKLKVHPLFVALLLGSVFLGMFRDTLTLFILILLHELGHGLTANALGYEVQEVSLLPFGGVAKLAYGNMGFRPRHEALVAISGPLVNLLVALFGFAMGVLHLWSDAFTGLVLHLNLWIAVFNLLPGLPLDGGRILRAARSRRIGFETATREAYRVAFILSFLLFIIGVFSLWTGHPHFGMLVLGLFLFVSAYTGRRDVRMDTMRFLDAKRSQNLQSPQEIRAIAAPGSTSVKEVVVQFAPDRYHLVYVMGESGNVQSVLEEEVLLDAVFEGRWLDKIETVI
jgi:stage IV sporulation protein FB